MLNKVKIGILVGACLMLVKHFFPGMPLPEGAEEIVTDFILLVAMGGTFFFTRETRKTVSRLKLKD
jgi:hypothetical protein